MKVSAKCDRAAKFFPTHLTKIREKAGLSKNALSEVAGLSQSYLVLLEQGARNPTLETLIRLSHGLEISLVEMVGEIDEEISEK